MEKQLPPISTLPQLTAPERAAILDRLFEPCVPLHTLSLELLHNSTFRDYDEMITSIGIQLTDLAESESTTDTKWLESILAAHPRLGEKVDSAQSSVEQAHLQADTGDDGMSLSQLNALYERTFPGLRYVVFVNGRSRDVIKQDMRQRIERSDIRSEQNEAIKAMCAIAADRARSLA